jgi:hypothetical protein
VAKLFELSKSQYDPRASAIHGRGTSPQPRYFQYKAGARCERTQVTLACDWQSVPSVELSRAPMKSIEDASARLRRLQRRIPTFLFDLH